MNIIESMKWRHASKAMNGKQVPQETIDKILEAISLTPTSLGLQAYKVFVIENKELKEKIFNESCQQQPIVGSSHILVFAARTEVADTDYDMYFKIMQEERKKETEYITAYRSKIEGFVETKVANNQPNWLTSQTYIALGVACVAAADAKIDSVPIEGFNKAKLDKILSLKEKGYKSTVLLPLGYSDQETDWWASEKKLRKNMEDFIEIIK